MELLFNKKIFRDIKNPDYQKNKFSVIFRVIRYGDMKDFKNLKKVYPIADIQSFLQRRGKEIDIGEKKLLDLLYQNA
ncbi:MAG: hypothetical protein CO170_02215 [candidate division SR1 bacterium CG_4_9_14_3_um_filter_40_9]|nr:MAG: hypothetical protein CO170_02215 [candidate division SR1 bacterium CG_4_9_14_3_um_filter_40_9]